VNPDLRLAKIIFRNHSGSDFLLSSILQRHSAAEQSIDAPTVPFPKPQEPDEFV
jgi:hypothetical protein